MCYSYMVISYRHNKSPEGRIYNQFCHTLSLRSISSSFHQFLLNIKLLCTYDTDSCISHMPIMRTFDTAPFTCLPEKDKKRDGIKAKTEVKKILRRRWEKKQEKVSYGLWKLRKKSYIPGAAIIGGKARVGYNFNIRWWLDFVIYEWKPLRSIILISIIVIIRSWICPKSSQSHGQQNWESLQVENTWMDQGKKFWWN